MLKSGATVFISPLRQCCCYVITCSTDWMCWQHHQGVLPGGRGASTLAKLYTGRAQWGYVASQLSAVHIVQHSEVKSHLSSADCPVKCTALFRRSDWKYETWKCCARKKMHSWKKQEWKMRHETAGLENARLENVAQNCRTRAEADVG